MRVFADTALDYLVKRTGSVKETCRLVGIDRHTYYNFQRRRREGAGKLTSATTEKIFQAFETYRAAEAADNAFREEHALNKVSEGTHDRD